jgi:hypothetical protein
MTSSTLIQKVWNFCHTLRDDGVGYDDYLEQHTYLLFLKLAHEYSQEPYQRDTYISKEYDWPSLKSKNGAPLEHAASKLSFGNLFGEPLGSIWNREPYLAFRNSFAQRGKRFDEIYPPPIGEQDSIAASPQCWIRARAHGCQVSKT